jgi:hypothetical protein
MVNPHFIDNGLKIFPKGSGKSYRISLFPSPARNDTFYGNKKADVTEVSSLWQLGHLMLDNKTRRFPPPSYEGFGFVGIFPSQ